MKTTKRDLTVITGQDDTIAALSRRRIELLAEDRKVTLRQIEAERDPSRSTHLAELLAKRAELAAEVSKVEQEWVTAVTVRAVREADRRGSEWRAVVYETAMAIVRLQALNRRRAQLAKEIRGKAVGPSLPCEIAASLLLGDGEMGGPANIYVGSVITAGIVTAGEVARVRAEIERGTK